MVACQGLSIRELREILPIVWHLPGYRRASAKTTRLLRQEGGRELKKNSRSNLVASGRDGRSRFMRIPDGPPRLRRECGLRRLFLSRSPLLSQVSPEGSCLTKRWVARRHKQPRPHITSQPSSSHSKTVEPRIKAVKCSKMPRSYQDRCQILTMPAGGVAGAGGAAGVSGAGAAPRPRPRPKPPPNPLIAPSGRAILLSTTMTLFQ